ncbi:MAG: sodium/proline symporter [Candidatus Glassbacteria bacterium]
MDGSIDTLGGEINQYTLVSFLGYLAVIVLVGFLSRKFSSRGIGEFFLGGRMMNRYVVALSAVVSGRSAWLILGVTGITYVQGLSAVWAVAGYITVELFLFLFLAPALRRQTERLDSLTIPDYFEARFQDKSGLLRITSVIIIFVFMTAYVAAQFKGGGKAFSASFGMSEAEGILLTAIIVLIYTVLGGFLAVSLTDMIQAVFMVFALLLLPVIAIDYIGGWDAVATAVLQQDVSFLDPFSLTAGAVIGFLGIGLGSPGNPHILVRYMSINDPKQLKVSAVVGTLWNVLMAAGAILIGLVGRAIYPEMTMLPGADRENLYPLLAQEHLHPLLFGLILAAIFAAIMSTADSQLLVASSAVVRDVYQKIVKKGSELDQRQLVLMSRTVVFILVCFSILLGYFAADWIFWLVLFAWGGLGASLGPTIIISLFWERTSRAGVFAGLVAGTSITIIWKSITALSDIVYELVPAFLISFVVTILVSLYSKGDQ